MLVRRFTIVCLLLGLFGMLFATLVAQARSNHRWGTVCVFDGFVCAPPANR